jgi:hypothetical protein
MLNFGIHQAHQVKLFGNSILDLDLGLLNMLIAQYAV